MQSPYTCEQIAQWLVRCFRPQQVIVSQLAKVKQKSGREIWTGNVTRGTETLPVVVKVFKPSAPEAVNANLSPVATARKCALAKQELRVLGLPTPICFGFTTEDETGVLAVEKLKQTAWTASSRVMAAQHLAHLHGLNVASLSVALQALVQQSDARPQRTRLWLKGNLEKLDLLSPNWRVRYPGVAAVAHELLVAPAMDKRAVTLVHGDYFSANLLVTAAGMRIIDWETLALGDSMWDLAFLIGADPHLAAAEVEGVTATYGAMAPLDLPSLLWYKQCWDIAWQLQDLVKQFTSIVLPIK